uniref:Methyltransferase n=1 Tax=Solanum lycopersicum TaxID=4081 RepID=A0A3Q7JFC5_SOLLC
MLSRFISKSSHLRLLTLISPKTHFINPKPISPKPYLFPHFFSTRNNNNNNNSNGRNSDPDFWKLSSETEQSVFNEDSESVEGIGKDDVSWGNVEEESGDVFKEAGEVKDGVGGGEEIWATAEGYKPWSFDAEGEGERVFDIGEDVKVESELMGSEEEAKIQSAEEKKLLELEEQVLTGVLKGPNRAFGDLIAASGITDEMMDSLLALKDLDGIKGLPPLSEIEDMRYEKNTRKSSRADIERQKQEEVAKARVKQVDEKGRAYGTGRRKCSIARVWVEPGGGKFMVNDKEFDVYFPMLDHRAVLLRPFTETKTLGMWNVRCTVKGGGVSAVKLPYDGESAINQQLGSHFSEPVNLRKVKDGQVGAIQLGISRALQNWDPELRPPLREGGYLTRDSRVVERKKPGKAKARKSYQWVTVLYMSKSGTLDLASGVGGKIEKKEVLSAVEKYEKYHACDGEAEEERKANYIDMVNKYYDLATSFYEYGWGESFHFAPRWKGESLRESIKRHEHFLALQLGVKHGQKILDVGCGIGGPLREIARFSDAYVTGINNNEYQVTRGKELNRIGGVDNTCNYVKADFMSMPFADDSFDGIFAIEATCHAPNVREVELGNGLPDIRSMGECIEALKHAGFEIIWDKDIAIDSPLPWYLPLDKSHFSLSNVRVTAFGRFFTRNMVKILERVGLAPEGSQKVQAMLEQAADALVEGGKEGIFTPMYFFLARKPAAIDPLT